MVVHVCFHSHWLSSVSKHVFFDHEFYIRSLELIESVSQLGVKHLLAVLLQEVEVSVLAAQQDRSVDFKQVLQYFAFVNFHPREDLLPHESSLYVVEGGSIDQPRQIDRYRVALKSWSIFCHVVRKELVIIDLDAKLVLGVRVFGQMIVAVLQEVGLLVRTYILSFALCVVFAVWAKVTIRSLFIILCTEAKCLHRSTKHQTFAPKSI